MNKQIILLALCLGCTSNTSPLEGAYLGTSYTDRTDCDTGEYLGYLDMDDGRYITEQAGQLVVVKTDCTYTLEPVTNTRANILPRSCTAVHDDGTLYHVTIHGGYVTVYEDELFEELFYTLDVVGGPCHNVNLHFVGWREE